jgi:hypothetical protein
MATPTLAQIRGLTIDYMQACAASSTTPRLDVIAARVAAIFTDPDAIVRMRIENRAGIYTLVAELERNGNTVTREWTPAGELRQDILADVYCAEYGATLRTVEGG